MKNPTRLWHPPRKRGGLGRGSFIMAPMLGSELLFSPSELETSRLELETSRLELETSRLELEMSRLELETSRLELETSRLELKTSLSKYGTLCFELEMSSS